MEKYQANIYLFSREKMNKEFRSKKEIKQGIWLNLIEEMNKKKWSDEQKAQKFAGL